MGFGNKKSSQKSQKSQKYLTVLKNSNFSFVESFNSLRTNILFSLPMNQNGCRKILFTSSNPAEGKSTTCVNTAISLAFANQRVLILDADLRKPTVHRYFDFDNSQGLSNILVGMCKAEECIKKVEGIDNLSVITAGVNSPNPSELLTGVGMEKFLNDLSPSFDFIIIDTPPVNAVTDALAVSKFADGVVLVTARNVTRIGEVNQAVSALKFAGANILGFVLNKALVHSRRYGHNSSYYDYYRTPSDTSQSTNEKSARK